MTVTVLVVDDQAMVREGFAALLGAEPDLEVVGQAADGHEALALCANLHPDVVLMDIRMPGLDGLSALRALTASRTPGDDDETPRVLVLTTFDLDEYVYEALRSGASGFLLKHRPPAEMIAAVRTVAGGSALFAPEVVSRLVQRFVSTGASLGTDAPLVEPLTPREREVLVGVARGRSNTEIASDLVVAEQTVKTHVSRVFAKLGVRDRAQAVVWAYENGVVSPGGQ